MTAKVLKFKFKRKQKERRIQTTLPNGFLFDEGETDLCTLFQNPNRMTLDQKNGLAQLAIAVIYADSKSSSSRIG